VPILDESPSDTIRKLFPTIYKLVKSLLVIPHENAESEQLFARLKLLKNKFSQQSTVSTSDSPVTSTEANTDFSYTAI